MAHATTTPYVIDLFCGAGGLSGGLERAGFRTAFAVDSNRDAIATLEATKAARIPIVEQWGRRYLQDTTILHADVSRISGGDLRPKGVRGRWRPDLLVGGPPCQPFSSSGKQRGIEDPRGQLFLEFVRLAEELQPRFILFENVRGLLTAKGPDGTPGAVLRLIQESFESIGYGCSITDFNSADIGAPQRRVRLYLFASRRYRLPDFPRRTHEKKCWVSLHDALAAMPDPNPEDLVFPSGKREGALRELAPGTGLKTGGVIEPHRPGGHWGYRQDSFVADLTLPARTIRAASTPDWILDETHGLRRLTWRECADLQGFHDRWQFTGSVAARFRQIGNAVEGTTAAALGTVIAAALGARQIKQTKSTPWPAHFHKRIKCTTMEERINGAARRAGVRTPIS